MEFKIEYEERINRVNNVTVDVKSEDEGELLTEKLYEAASNWDHPDCIFEALGEMGVPIIDKCIGTEDVEYEIQ